MKEVQNGEEDEDLAWKRTSTSGYSTGYPSGYPLDFWIFFDLFDHVSHLVPPTWVPGTVFEFKLSILTWYPQFGYPVTFFKLRIQYDCCRNC